MERDLVQVSRLVVVTPPMPDPELRALREEMVGLYGVGVRFAADILAGAVIDGLMSRVALADGAERLVSVGHQRCVRRDHPFEERLDFRDRSILHLLRPGAAATLGGNEDPVLLASPAGRIADVFRGRRAVFPAVRPLGILANKHVIDFDHAAERRLIGRRLHHQADGVPDLPGGLLGDSDLLREGDRTDPFARRCDEKGRLHPGLDRQLGLMERRAARRAELLVAATAVVEPSPLAAFDRQVIEAPAVEAESPLRPAQPLEEPQRPSRFLEALSQLGHGLDVPELGLSNSHSGPPTGVRTTTYGGFRTR